MNFYEENIVCANFYEENYDVIACHSFAPGQHIQLQDHDVSGQRFCRFCGKRRGEVPFKQTAHAVPVFLGNKSIISYNECDNCNRFISQQYEDHLAKYLRPALALSRVSGRNGVPTYKNSDIRIEDRQGVHLDFKENVFNESIISSGKLDLDLPSLETQKHIPINAAKAFIKSICSVMPKEELDYCQDTIRWLMENGNIKFKSFSILFSFVPGNSPLSPGSIKIIRRKNDTNIPYIWGIFSFANFVYQVMLPFCSKDKWLISEQKHTITTRCYPLPISKEYFQEYGDPAFSCIDFAEDIGTSKTHRFSLSLEKAENPLHPPARLSQLKASIIIKNKEGAIIRQADDFLATLNPAQNDKVIISHLLNPLHVEFEINKITKGRIRLRTRLDMTYWSGKSILNLYGLDFLYNFFNVSKNIEIKILTPTLPIDCCEFNNIHPLSEIESLIESLFKLQKICQTLQIDIIFENVISGLDDAKMIDRIDVLYRMLILKGYTYPQGTNLPFIIQGSMYDANKQNDILDISNIPINFIFWGTKVEVVMNIKLTNFVSEKGDVVDGITKYTIKSTCNSIGSYEVISWRKLDTHDDIGCSD